MRLPLFCRGLHRPNAALSDPVKRVPVVARWLAWDTFLLFLLLTVLLVLSPRADAETPTSIQMKLLVISANGTEPSFAAIQSNLKQLGVPYDALIATTTPFSASNLSDGLGGGKYQGIMLATGNLGYQAADGSFQSAFSAAQWQALWNYEATFRVRQVTLYTFPGGLPDSYGLILNTGLDTTTSPVQAQLTPTGRTVFNYLNPTNPVTIKNAWTYLATPASSTNPVPLLKTSAGYAIASIYTYPDGRQNLAVTADSNPDLIHALSLGYGLINWVSKGMFLGQRRVYMNPQPDDVLIDDDIWDPSVNRENGATYRITGTDFTDLVYWQNAFQNAHPTAGNLTLELPFNGIGSVAGEYPNDTLTPAIISLESWFKWLSHTYTHANLDAISYNDALTELRKNNQVANNTLLLSNYFKDSMIQPDVSGLNNPQFLQAAHDFGMHYLVSDTSQPGWNNPSPNAGFYSIYQPSILIIPRHPTNLYYNVSTPAEWISEYNYFYAPGGLFPTWDHALSYAEVLDKESDIMLRYLLKYDIDPLMFHQPNLRAYDGVNNLLGDLINATVVKYEKLFKLPIRSPSHHGIGVLMAARMAYDASGATGTLQLGLTNTINLKTVKAAKIPVTGINFGTAVENYGGQPTSSFTLAANGSVLIPAPAW